MPTSERRCSGRRVLFLQATDAAGYPPLIHASMLMAGAGWDVTFLSAPFEDYRLELPCHPHIAVRTIPTRPTHVMGKAAYTRYIAAAARLAMRFEPDVVYASDPLGAGPGLLAARLARARLVYHEHDSPASGSLPSIVARTRAAAARRAELVVFPNEARARIAQAELGFAEGRLRVVWNMPRRAELPPLDRRPAAPLVVYYHGSIGPGRLPLTVVEAVRRLGDRACLRIAGYEAPGAPGYVRRLVELGADRHPTAFVDYAGQVPGRADLVSTAARAHVGIALVSPGCDDINMRHMTGASNKPFDYMAAGLALLVSERPDWRQMFVAPGYARACDPSDPDSIAAALTWLLDHPAERHAMAARGRAKIETEWNYDVAFEPIMGALARG